MITKFKERGYENKTQDVEYLEKEVSSLSKKVQELVKENRDLNQLVAILQDDEIVTFQNGRYCNEIREVIMELVSLNVTVKKVNVIKCVLSKNYKSPSICRNEIRIHG